MVPQFAEVMYRHFPFYHRTYKRIHTQQERLNKINSFYCFVKDVPKWNIDLFFPTCTGVTEAYNDSNIGYATPSFILGCWYFPHQHCCPISADAVTVSNAKNVSVSLWRQRQSGGLAARVSGTPGVCRPHHVDRWGWLFLPWLALARGLKTHHQREWLIFFSSIWSVFQGISSITLWKVKQQPELTIRRS